MDNLIPTLLVLRNSSTFELYINDFLVLIDFAVSAIAPLGFN